MAFNVITDLWSVTSYPSVATAATASKAAGAGGVRHVAKRVLASVAAGATAQTPIVFALRDGATAAGTVLVEWACSAIVNTFGLVDAEGLHLIGTAATAMTLETTTTTGGAAAATAAAVQGVVTLIGYDF